MALAFFFLATQLSLTAILAEDSSPPTAQDVKERRREIIRYGTDAEILKLVTDLETEKAEYLDDELLAVLESTKNGKIISTVFGFFGRRKITPAEPRAIRTIRDRDMEANEAVEAAIDYLGRIASKEAPAALKEVLESEEARFMESAVRALGRSGGGEVADENAAYLLSYYEEREPSDGLKQVIVSALGELRSKAATAFLSDLARNGDEKAVRRMAALEAIGMIGDPEGLDAVLESLTASDANVRAVAVGALGPFSGDKVDGAILEAFRDSFYKARSAAAKAAGQRKLEAAIQYLRYRAERDEVPAVREDAIRALGAIGSASALDAVRSIFNEKKQIDRVRIAAAATLLEHDEAGSANGIVAALDEAKKQKRTALYNGLLKALSEGKSQGLEDFTRRLLGSEDITDKLYGLDLAKGNGFRSLESEIKKLAEDKNLTLSLRAQDVLKSLESR
jgi:HEAT repeat protein